MVAGVHTKGLRGVQWTPNTQLIPNENVHRILDMAKSPLEHGGR